MRKKIYFGLSVKIIIAVSSIIIFTSIILNWFFITGQAILLKTSIDNRVVALANSLARSSEFAVSSPQPSKEFLYHLGKNCLKEPNVVYSAIYDVNGEALTIQPNTNADLTKYIESTPIDVATIKKLKDTGLQKDINGISNVGEVMDILVPIISTPFDTNISESEREKVVGVVRIGVELNNINYQIEKTKKFAFLITIAIVFIGILFSFFIAGIIFKSLEKEFGIKK